MYIYRPKVCCTDESGGAGAVCTHVCVYMYSLKLRIDFDWFSARFPVVTCSTCRTVAFCIFVFRFLARKFRYQDISHCVCTTPTRGCIIIHMLKTNIAKYGFKLSYIHFFSIGFLLRLSSAEHFFWIRWTYERNEKLSDEYSYVSSCSLRESEALFFSMRFRWICGHKEQTHVQ